jgi:hypothetical protein
MQDVEVIQMLENINSKKESIVQYRVSLKSVDELLKTIELKTKETHSKSFFISLRNRKLSISNATKTA